MIAASATILIVDDEPANRKLLETLLRDEGYGTLCVAGGEAALAAMRENTPDLILLDVKRSCATSPPALTIAAIALAIIELAHTLKLRQGSVMWEAARRRARGAGDSPRATAVRRASYVLVLGWPCYAIDSWLRRAMGNRILSARGGRIAAQRPTTYLLWISARQAVQFREPGWEPLMPPRNGGVLFLNRARRDELGLVAADSAATKASAAAAGPSAAGRVTRHA